MGREKHMDWRSVFTFSLILLIPSAFLYGVVKGSKGQPTPEEKNRRARELSCLYRVVREAEDLLAVTNKRGNVYFLENPSEYQFDREQFEGIGVDITIQLVERDLNRLHESIVNLRNR
jgi:hypothetical protein